MQLVGVGRMLILHRREEDQVSVAVLDDIKALPAKLAPITLLMHVQPYLSDEVEICDAVDTHGCVTFA